MAGWLRKRIVVPVDFSETSLAAVGTAREMVADPGDLYVLHVLPELSPAEPGEIWATITDETRIAHVRKALAEKLDRPDLKGLHIDARVGTPAHTIVGYAEEIGADTIVLPSHGRTGLAHLLIGSVAERVVRHASCPVVVLRGGASAER